MIRTQKGKFTFVTLDKKYVGMKYFQFVKTTKHVYGDANTEKNLVNTAIKVSDSIETLKHEWASIGKILARSDSLLLFYDVKFFPLESKFVVLSRTHLTLPVDEILSAFSQINF